MSRTRAALFAAAMALSLVAAAPTQSAELITNGDFELGLADWVVTGNVAALEAADYVPCCGVTGTDPAFTDNTFASFGSGEFTGLNAISQSFRTVIGSNYTLRFDAGAFGGNTNLLITSVAGAVQNYTLTANNNADITFNPYTFDFTGSGYDTLTFAVTTTPDSTDALVDNVSVTGLAVPEPATWAMMIMGFGAMGSALRRSRQRQLTVV